MNKSLIALGLSALMASGSVAQSSHFQRTDFDTFTSTLGTRANKNNAREWHYSGKSATNSGTKRVITEMQTATTPSSYWGSLMTPNGEEWMYTMDYTYSMTEEGFSTISSAFITIYDSNFNVYKTFTADFTLTGNQTTINSVQMSPNLSKKFFNINDEYEVMLFVHATTADYTGNIYTQVYTLSDGSLITTLPGDNIAAVNTATDSWSEKFTMVFMREEVDMSEDEYKYMLFFDVYSRAGWSSGCKLEHTFAVDYSLFAGAGNSALPILVNKHDNRVYYVLPYYEKPYFESEISDEITPDNNFVINLYDDSFNLVKTTKIPIELEEDAIFSFPGIGELRGNYDFSFDENGNPVYVVGVENYVVTTDDFMSSLYVYDSEGNRINTIVQNADDYLLMSDVAGCEEQVCFLFVNDNYGYFRFVDIPSYNTVAEIPLMLDGATISTSIDRAAAGESYKYASSILVADSDSNGDTIHKIAWFNNDGSLDRIDRINLGKSIALAQVNVLGDALNPYLFNTDDNMEYMFLVKQYNSSTSTASTEYFRIYNDQSEVLLDVGPDKTTGQYLNYIFLMNTQKVNPKLVVSYYANDTYTMHSLDLPLVKFGGGEGTEQSPYQLSSAGDIRAIQSAPHAYYEVVADIDMGNSLWTGNKCTFTGVLDGKGHTISNIKLSGNGMFNAIANEAKVVDLNIKGVDMEARSNTGIIAGDLEGNDGKNTATIKGVNISDVNVHGNLSGDDTFGGIVGTAMLFASIDSCSVTNAHIDFADKGLAGGIVGVMITSSKVSNTLFDGWINASVAGGIAGQTWSGDETLTNCHAHAEIEASQAAGGIIGSSARSLVNNCYVDGNIKATGHMAAHSGGIVGQLKSTYEEYVTAVVNNCLVAANVTSNPEAKESIAHKIAGFTSIDEKLVDWESNDPNVDWSDPSTYPYLDGTVERGLNGNLAIVAELPASQEPGADATPEGLLITKEQLSDEVLQRHNWAMGAEWKQGANALLLTREDLSLTAKPEELSVYLINGEDDEAKYYAVIECASRYADLMSIEVSDESVAKISEPTLSADGRSVVCEVYYVADGVCTITATLDDQKATCTVLAIESSIKDVVAEAKTINYDGKYISSPEGMITVYDMTGKQVLSGREQISVHTLAKGAYIATNGKESIKILK